MAEPSCLINCTIPVKLRDFLKDEGINRSELFRKAALNMYEHKICPKCYSSDIIDEYKGKICRDCNRWLTQRACPLCDVLWAPDRHGTHLIVDGEKKIVCSDCFKIKQEELDAFYNEELSKVNKDE